VHTGHPYLRAGRGSQSGRPAEPSAAGPALATRPPVPPGQGTMTITATAGNEISPSSSASLPSPSLPASPVVWFSPPWARFLKPVVEQLEQLSTDGRRGRYSCVTSLDGVDPGRVVAIVGGGPPRLEDLCRLPNVALLQQPWTGTDWLAQTDRRLPPTCTVCNVHGMDQPIAEYVLGTMLDNAIGFSALSAEFHETGSYRPPFPREDGYQGRPYHGELAGRTLGIVGFGSIGAEVARRAAAFDMRVVATTRTARDVSPAHVSWMGVGVGADLDKLLTESDYVLLSCPLTDETHGLLNAARCGLWPDVWRTSQG
jgi:phosphoglycerate dehydrogenase-like enzyme